MLVERVDTNVAPNAQKTAVSMGTTMVGDVGIGAKKNKIVLYHFVSIFFMILGTVLRRFYIKTKKKSSRPTGRSDRFSKNDRCQENPQD
jgi:hypothetical protein